MPIYKTVNKSFFKSWNPQMAYTLGFFFADGSLDINPRGSHYLSFHTADKSLLVAIRKALLSDHRIAERKTGVKQGRLFRLQIGSREMFVSLQRLGVSILKAETMELPSIPGKLFGDFLRGYFDGDGNIWVGHKNIHRKKPVVCLQIAFTSSSSLFLRGLWEKLKEKGIKGGCLYQGKGNYYRLQFSTKNALKIQKIMYNQSVLKKSDLFLERKRKVFGRYHKLRSLRS